MRLGWNDVSLLRPPREYDDGGVDADIDAGIIIGAVAGGGVGERDDRPTVTRRPPSLLMERDDPFEEEDAPWLLLVGMMFVR